jgi:hypothetical protein
MVGDHSQIPNKHYEDEMACKWTLKGEGAELVIHVDSYERPVAEDESDANWLSCRVAGAMSGFSGLGKYSIVTSEFVGFEDALRAGLEQLSGSVNFSTMEKGLGWDIKFNGRGQAIVSGFLKSSGSPTATLSFSFQSDQSYLQQTLSELIRVNREFPIRTVA